MGIHSFTNGNSATPPTPLPGGLVGGPQRATPASNGVVPDLLIDYNEKFGNAAPAQFRDALIAQTQAVLIRQKKPNPLLVGPAGVGKTRIVEELARRIAISDPSVPAKLADSTIYELPLGALIAGSGVVGELESRVLEIISFIADPANDSVLFIDEVHLLVDRHDPSYAKLSQLLKPAMARGDLRMIAATTTQEARKLDNDPAFARRFGQLIVDELSIEQSVDVVSHALPGLLRHYRNGVVVPADLLPVVAEVSEQYRRADQHRPDSVLTLLDQAMADLVVTNQAVRAASAAQGIALGPGNPPTLNHDKLVTVARRIASGNAQPLPLSRLASIGRNLTDTLLGQDRACGRISSAVLRESLQLTTRTRPMTWLFAGPSGVGKTQAAKIMAEALTGLPPVVLNMNEYGNRFDQSKLLGSGPGYVGSESNRELPFDLLDANPYRLILLDELEKADTVVHQLLLGALDEGWLRMAMGKVIDFSKAIVVATTNAGAAELNGSSVGFTGTGGAGSAGLPETALAKTLQRNGFAAEFLGRFEHLVVFDALALDTYTAIVHAELDTLIGNPALTNRSLVVPVITDDEVIARARASYNPALGARPAKRAAKELLEDALLAANPLLAHIP